MNSFSFFASLFVVVLCFTSALSQVKTTTTAVPTTSTTPVAKNTTTPAATSSTTPVAKNTTTPAGVTNTTTAAPTTSTAAPTTTVAPVEPKNTYNVTEDNVVCIKMISKIDLAIKYEKKKDRNVTVNVPVPAEFTTSGHCGNTSQALMIKFYKGWELEYTFSKDGNTNYFVSQITLKYNLDSTHFPDAVKQNADMNVTISPKSGFMKGNKNGYVCKSKIDEGSGDVEINTEELKYVAFNSKGDPDLKKSGLECSADEDTNSIVPIAVGAALAGLVVIVLIAYLIGRKRTRKTGYESV